MPKLVIIDGNSLLYRGFYAMKYLSTSDGTPTNAVFSFTNMLLYILENEKPDAIYAAFDPPGGTFRHVELPSYKGQRKEMPDELKPQRQLARDAANAFRVPVVEIEGFEADDVCGTMAKMGKENGYQVVIVTGDGDALQLVDDTNGPVTVMMTVKGVTDTVIYNEEAVKARYGLTPQQIPDFKGLKGDSSDNLPGVPGIGEKGASKLLQQYGTVEGLIEHAADLPEKTRVSLLENRDIALQCKDLATIRCDVDLPGVTLEPNYQTAGPDFAALRALFARLEFKQLNKRIVDLERQWRARDGNADSAGEPEAEHAKIAVAHRTLTSAEDISAALKPLSPPSLREGRGGTFGEGFGRGADDPWIDRVSRAVAVALHYTPPKAYLMDAELLGISLGLESESVYIAKDAVTDELKAFLGDPRIPKTTHDLKFTMAVLGRHGIPFDGGVFDTLIAAYLINAGRAHYALTELARDYGGVDLIPDPEDAVANTMDQAAAVRAVTPVMAARLEKDELVSVFRDIDLPIAPILANLERQGVCVDFDLLAQASQKMGAQVAVLEAEIWELAGQQFSIGSTKQLQEILFEKLQLPSGRKTKTGYSTGSEVLEDLASKGHVIATKIVKWRELTKLKSTYTDLLPTLVNKETGKIHTSLNQTIAATGRLSSNNPNLQNIPIRTEVGREIRKAFVASPGCVLLSADYSQVELRIFAAVTKDPALVQAFLDDSDIHSQTARRVFGLADDAPVTPDQRRQAKTINFAVIYGAGPFRVSAELGIPQKDASVLIKAYLSSYPGVREYIDKTLDKARECGYVQTLFGRRRYVPDLLSGNFQFRQAAEREAANMPIQGTAADIMKLAMIKVDHDLRESGIPASMILQVHDELLFECAPEDVGRLAALVRHAMETAYEMDVKLGVEVKSGDNWWAVTPVSADEVEVVA